MVIIYKRVVPRDFFNESKLLKCLGQFELCVLDKKVGGLKFEIDFDHKAFDICQNEHTGDLFVLNYTVMLDGLFLYLYIPYNSKENYPLEGVYKGDIYNIFDETGKFLPNFGVSNEKHS